MEENSSGNAMTEVALALAMAFFSVMVLTMVSMGAGGGDTAKQKDVDAALLAPHNATAGAGAKTKTTADDVIIIHYDGKLFDKNLRLADLSAIAGAKRVVLALDPSLALDEAMAVRARIHHSNLIVSTLDESWLATLRTRQRPE